MDAFTALAEPRRRELLDVLARGPQTVNALSSATGMPQPSVSKHLKVLHDAGLVTKRAQGPQRRYSLATDGFVEIDEWLLRLRTQWSDRLDALEAHLDGRAP